MGRDSVSFREHNYGVRIAVIAFLLFRHAACAAATDPSHASTGNDITLREYVDVRFEAQDKAVQSALAAADRANAKAEAASDKRFDSVNEFRTSLNDQTRTLMPRAEAEQANKAINEKLDNLILRMNTIDDRGRGANESWVTLVAIIGVIGTIGGFSFALFKATRAAQ